jgi:hypothetical protein
VTTLDFSGIQSELSFDDTTREYQELVKMNSDEYGEFVNKMLGKGVSVVYDAKTDIFHAKPTKLKKESEMKPSKQNLKGLNPKEVTYLFEGDSEILERDLLTVLYKNRVRYNLYENCVSVSKAELDRVKVSIHTIQEKSGLEYIIEGEEKPETANNKENKFLLFDDEEESVEEGGEDEEDMDIENDTENVVNTVDGVEAEEPTEIEPTTTEEGAPQVNYTQEDLEALIRKILGQGQGEEQVAEAQPSTPQTYFNVPLNNTGPNILDTEFKNEQELTGDVEQLSAIYGHPGVETLNTEFETAQEDLSVVQDKIENEPTYMDYLEGDASKEEFDMYNTRKDGFDAETYSEDNTDFSRNASLVSTGSVNIATDVEEGEGSYEHVLNPPIAEPLDAPTAPVLDAPVADVLEPKEPMAGLSNVVSQRPDMIHSNPTAPASSLNIGGQQIQIVLTGVILSEAEIKYVAASVKKYGMKLKKIHSKVADELNFVVEHQGKDFTINYKDVDKNKNQYPFTTKEGKHQSLNEALYTIGFDATKAKAEKANAKKMLSEDLINRNVTNINESDIFKGYESAANISTWTVKSVGSINLKTGINESFSNITQHNKEYNTLVQTENGNYFLFKGNLKEVSKVGTKRTLIDLDNKKAYGKATVIGLYENTNKGLGQIMFKTKRTSLPLLIWK